MKFSAQVSKLSFPSSFYLEAQLLSTPQSPFILQDSQWQFRPQTHIDWILRNVCHNHS